ncbi:MAG: hypothetical protein KME18_09300 [Phormidium tanganyikae FI6-MK23]|jgi:hypothetical protein|nr:hypothetical protein [Phormidium tanganyikae FI6-MK23]
MTIFKSLIFLSILTLSLPAIAQTKQVLTDGCRQGSCWEMSLLSKKLVHQNQLGGEANKFYRIETETKMTGRTSKTERASRWVYCSTSQPFVAFTSTSENLIYIHYLNPGGNVGGYNSGSNRIYWAICHNVWNAKVLTPEEGLARKAQQLGYSLSLQSVQREIPKQLFQP